MAAKKYDLNAFAQDPFSLKQRANYVSSIYRDMMAQDYLNKINDLTGINLYNSNPKTLPQSKEELEVHMQLNYKQSIEIAEEEAINNTLSFNKYQLTNKRIIEDIVTIGIGAVKTSFNKSEGVVIDYVDPANLVYSYTNDPNFEDIYYVGEIKSMTLAEIKNSFHILQIKKWKKWLNILVAMVT